MNYAVVYFLKNSESINEFRQKYDPLANIIHPHVTIVAPIAVEQLDEQSLIMQIQTILQQWKPFPVIFSELEKSWDNCIFLTATEEIATIRSLHDNLYSGLLAKFQHDTVYVPHVTLGDFDKHPNLFTQAFLEATQQAFVLTEIVDTLSLIKGDGKSPTRTIQEFSL